MHKMSRKHQQISCFIFQDCCNLLAYLLTTLIVVKIHHVHKKVSQRCIHCNYENCSQLNGSVKEPNILIYFFFPPITQWCYISDVLFTGGREVSDFSVLKYYQLNINYSLNILRECLRILIDCSQLSKTYNMLFGSSTRDRHA